MGFLARRHGLITSITAAHGTWQLDAHSQRNPVPGQEVTLRSTQVRRCWTLTELQHTSHTHTHTHIGTHAQQVARARVRAVRPVCIGLARAMIILTHSLGQQGISFAKSFCTNKSSLASSFPACLLSACFDFVREMRMEIPAEQLAKRKD